MTFEWVFLEIIFPILCLLTVLSIFTLILSANQLFNLRHMTYLQPRQSLMDYHSLGELVFAKDVNFLFSVPDT